MTRQLKPIKAMSLKRMQSPQPGDRMDGPGGRRIVIRTHRSLMGYDKEKGTLSIVRKAFISWRHPYSQEAKHCLRTTWDRWAKKAHKEVESCIYSCCNPKRVPKGQK
jgi:hypothetical protein